MSASALNTSASPSTADVTKWTDFRPGLTQGGHSTCLTWFLLGLLGSTNFLVVSLVIWGKVSHLTYVDQMLGHAPILEGMLNTLLSTNLFLFISRTQEA